MEKTDKVTKIVSFLLFLALVAYVGVYLWNAASDSTVTALAVNATIEESTTVTGLAIREEEYLASGAENVGILAQEGSRVSAGAAVAVELSGTAALERVNRMRELELEIARVQTLLEAADTESLGAGEAAIRSAVSALTGAIARHDLTNLDALSMSLRSLVMADQSGSVSERDLSALEQELQALRTSETETTRAITAPSAGIFSEILDGYEDYDLSAVRSLTPSALREILLSGGQSVPENAFGKLVTGFVWYFAAVVDAEEAAVLEEGDSVELEFGRYYDGSVSATVAYLGQREGDEQVVIFSCLEALEETLAMRQASADIIFASYSGIRVPAEAIRYDEDGDAYVYTITGMQAERKYVEIVYEAQDFCLVEAAGDAGALRAGNEIIVSGKDLHDGKVLD